MRPSEDQGDQANAPLPAVTARPSAQGTAATVEAIGCRQSSRTRPASSRHAKMMMVTIAGVRRTAGRKTTAVSGVVETRCCASSPGSFLNIRLEPSLDLRPGRPRGRRKLHFWRPRLRVRPRLVGRGRELGLFDVEALAVGQVARGGVGDLSGEGHVLFGDRSAAGGGDDTCASREDRCRNGRSPSAPSTMTDRYGVRNEVLSRVPSSSRVTAARV